MNYAHAAHHYFDFTKNQKKTHETKYYDISAIFRK